MDAPLVLAASQLRNGQPDRALLSLQTIKPYEFGRHAGLLPNYLRAVVYYGCEEPTKQQPTSGPC
jgi:hypothetical protein